MSLLSLIKTRKARVGVIGLGYVGLPLAMTVARAGFTVTGFDIDPGKIMAIIARKSYIEAVLDTVLAVEVEAGRFAATGDFATLGACDIIVICVPTPLTRPFRPTRSTGSTWLSWRGRSHALWLGRQGLWDYGTKPGWGRPAAAPFGHRAVIHPGRPP